jgi:type II secretory pathway pseudopilin PulG
VERRYVEVRDGDRIVLRTVTRNAPARGFALLEAIVGMVMLAIMAAAIVPLIAGAEDRLRAEETVRDLDHLKSAIDRFKDKVAVYPKLLEHLVDPIATSDANSCGTAYSVGQTNSWANDDVKHGPWFNNHMVVKSFGFPTAVGFVRDSTTRSGSNLIIWLTDVAEAQALELDAIVDSTSGVGAASGEIRWGAIVDGVTSVQYTLNRSGC